MNVLLSRKNQMNGNREYFHREYAYPSKYHDYPKVITIRRSFYYYISIDKLDMKDKSIIIRMQDMIILKMRLKEISNWFFGDTFGIKNNQLIVAKKKTPIIIDNLAMNKYLKFEPLVLINDNTGVSSPGLRITISDENAFTDISDDAFFAFYYLMDTFNMFLAAQNMVNYLGRPEMGTNLMEFEEERIPETQDEISDPSTGKKRQIGVFTQKKSFFDEYE